MIKSSATIADTLEFCKKHTGLNYKTLGKTALTVSACGFGSYRVDYRVKEHSEALEYALLNGINLIDTSANYSDGGSEILIGRVLEKLVNENKIKREEIVVVSKGGYIQGKNFEQAAKMKEDGVGYREVVEYTENLWHSIHPDFLRDQITFSLERMQLEKIDVYLLHNPEYFLDSPLAKELSLDELRHIYYSRIRKSFEYLETEVAAGRIGYFGISSNSFVYNEDDQTFTSLYDCIKAAKECGAVHFGVIQFPMNLHEKGAILNENQRAETKTLLDCAADNRLGTIVNRPLNAITQKSLMRLSDFETNPGFLNLDEAQIVAEINILDSMEEDFITNDLPTLGLDEKTGEAVRLFMRAGQLMKENWKNFGTMESFNDVKKQFLIPRVNYAFTSMLGSGKVTDEMKDKLDRIARQVNRLIAILETIYGVKANLRSAPLKTKLNEILGTDNGLSFSQKALLMITSLETVSCVLAGMRQEKYADNVLGVLKHKPIDAVEEKWAAL